MSFSETTESSEYQFSSVDEYNSFDELDAESASTFDSMQASKCYWLGKMFMRFVQAYVVLNRSTPSETVTEVDVKLEDRLRSYSYTNSLKSLQDCIETSVPPNLRPNTVDDYEAFMCAVGIVITRNTQLDSPEISTMLRSLQCEGDDIANQWASALSTKAGFNQTQIHGTDVEADSIDYYGELCRHLRQTGENVQKKDTLKKNRQGKNEGRKKALNIAAQKAFFRQPVLIGGKCDIEQCSSLSDYRDILRRIHLKRKIDVQYNGIQLRRGFEADELLS